MTEHFPKTIALLLSYVPAAQVNERPTDLLKPKEVYRALHFIQKIHYYFQGREIDTYIKFTEELWVDLVELRRKFGTGEGREIINYLQLTSFTDVIGRLNGLGYFSYSYDAIIMSVMDVKIENGEDLTIENERLWDLLRSRHPVIAYDSGSLVTTWLAEFFYCSYSQGSFASVCNDYFEPALQLSKSTPLDEEKLRLLLNVNSWTIRYKPDIDNGLRIILKDEYARLDWEDSMKPMISFHLIHLQDLPLEERQAYYKELKTNKSFKGHEHLQLLSSIANTPDTYKVYNEEIRKAAKECSDHIEQNSSSEIESMYGRARLFKIMIPVIRMLVENGYAKELTVLLSSYYGNTNRLAKSILYLIPFHPEGIIYAYHTETLKIEQNSEKFLREITRLYNALFNTTLSAIGDMEALPVPERVMGIPKPEFAQLFEEKALQMYGFEKLDKDFPKGLEGMLQLSFHSLPIQSLMLKYIDRTLPIKVSFSENHPKSRKEKVLIYAEGTGTSDLEKIALTKLCESYQVPYSVLERDCSKAEFLKSYAKKDWSIVWIGTHGEHMHYEPHKSSLILEGGLQVGIDELIVRTPNIPFNRLLMLNMCESGLNSEMDGFKGIGFSHQLASPKQSIVSHLWSIEPKMAMAFGVLVAIGIIARNLTYFEAYCFAIKALIKGVDHVIASISEELGTESEIVERLQNSGNIEWDSFLSWGSGAFYS